MKVNQKPPRRKFTFKYEHWHGVALLLGLYDSIAVALAYFLALWMRFDLNVSAIPREYFNGWLYFTPLYVVFCLFIFWVLRLYKSMWRFASYTELLRVIAATIITGLFQIVGARAARGRGAGGGVQ